MNSLKRAQSAYGAAANCVKTPKAIETDIIVRITTALSKCDKAQKQDYPAFVEALDRNRKLWSIIAADVAQSENGLPQDLRSRLFYLAEFTRTYTSKILAEKVSVTPLLEVNTAVIKGLRNG